MAPIATSQTTSPRRTDAGYTLTELLVVLVIIAAVAAISIPLLRPSPAVQARSFAERAAAVFVDAQAHAAVSGRETVVWIDVEKGAAWRDGGMRVRAGDQVQLEATGAQSERSGASLVGVRFFPEGGSTGGTVIAEGAGRIFEARADWLTGRASAGPVSP